MAKKCNRGFKKVGSRCVDNRARINVKEKSRNRKIFISLTLTKVFFFLGILLNVLATTQLITGRELSDSVLLDPITLFIVGGFLLIIALYRGSRESLGYWS